MKTIITDQNRGFTLIEILVALIIMTVAVSVVLSSQLVSLKIEQKAHILQLFRFETRHIFSATHRAKNEGELMNLTATDNLCRVKSEPVQMELGTNKLTIIKHEMSADDLPSFSSLFYTRVPVYPCRSAGSIEAPPK